MRTKTAKPPFAEGPLPRIGSRDPIVHRTRDNPDRVRRLRFLPDGNEKLRAVPFLWVSEGLDLIESRVVQVNMLAKCSHIARLLADDLGGRVLHNSGSMLVGTVLSADKILRRLADPPNTGIAFASGAKELYDDAGKNRRFKQCPALIEQNDARLTGRS
jgi:hypothetical protein